ncbi:GntR family transcriptional regulator [Mesorhizobium loti]|nr:GntR family transcriptional regulator [Mesorhizobium loti]
MESRALESEAGAGVEHDFVMPQTSPKYREIYRRIRETIERGVLRAGAPLPSAGTLVQL